MSAQSDPPSAPEPPTAFYEGAGDSFASTDLTRGPWDPSSQHAGPPSALIARGIERCPGVGEDVGDRHIARITLEILRPVPIAALRCEAEVVRPGRRVDMVDAVLRDAEGEPLIRARAWRMLSREVELPDGLTSTDEDSPARRAGRPGGGAGAPEPPDRIAASTDFFPTGHDVGYHTAMEYRFVAGSFLETGPATTWLRMRVPLIAGESPSPLQRVLAAADSGNGVSSALDYREYVFINVDLTVHLHRPPAGEWVCLDSITVPEPSGVGMTDTMLFDERGPIGRAAQSLLVDRRSRG
jgi:hypothetical protein